MPCSTCEGNCLVCKNVLNPAPTDLNLKNWEPLTEKEKERQAKKKETLFKRAELRQQMKLYRSLFGDKYQQLVKAVQMGNSKTVSDLLEQDHDMVNVPPNDQWKSLLVIALENNDEPGHAPIPWW